MTGEGDVLPFVATGNPPTGAALTQPPAPRLDFTMTVGDAAVTPQFVGIPSWSIGVTQVNFAVPAKLAPGVYPVVFTVGGVPSSPIKLTVGAASANVLVTFIPPSVNQASDGKWHYTTQLTETGGAGVNLTKLMVFNKDYTDQISTWFGATRLPANGTLSGSFVANCSNCSPPWDGTWQISGTDDSGNSNTWSGTVHFLPPSTSGTANAAKGKPMFKGSRNAVTFSSKRR
jgi:hypothetical protein